MSHHAYDEPLARIAADIMFGKKYTDLLETIYSQPSTIAEFEKKPKQFLNRNGIDVPDAIEVIIHDPGSVGRPARVDFHWQESDHPASGRESLRLLARVAWDTLHSPAMKRVKIDVQASPSALKEFASDPKAYLAAHDVAVPEGIEVIVHPDNPKDVRIDCHFGTVKGKNRMDAAEGGCCYCEGHGCCYYAD